MDRLLDYYTAVLERAEVLPPQGNFAEDVRPPTVPTEVYSTILTGARHGHFDATARHKILTISKKGSQVPSPGSSKDWIVIFVYRILAMSVLPSPNHLSSYRDMSLPSSSWIQLTVAQQDCILSR